MCFTAVSVLSQTSMNTYARAKEHVCMHTNQHRLLLPTCTLTHRFTKQTHRHRYTNTYHTAHTHTHTHTHTYIAYTCIPDACTYEESSEDPPFRCTALLSAMFSPMLPTSSATRSANVLPPADTSDPTALSSSTCSNSRMQQHFHQ